MPDAPAPSHPSIPDSPLLHHLVSQLTVIKAQAQMIRRRMDEPDPESGMVDVVQARAFNAIDLAVDQAMAQLLIAGRGGRMPLEPLDADDDAA
jgi:hypothetical protein